jgi:hypothetical protein
MEKAFRGECYFESSRYKPAFDQCRYRTPYGLDVSLPNKERGILHIENGNYWKFYNLE